MTVASTAVWFRDASCHRSGIKSADPRLCNRVTHPDAQ